MTPTQAEMLLRMAENTYGNNDELLAETRKRLSEGAQQILNDEEYLIKAWEINQRDKTRFMQYMPSEVRQAASQQATTMGRSAIGRTLAEQRAALGVIRDEGKDERTQQARQNREGQGTGAAVSS